MTDSISTDSKKNPSDSNDPHPHWIGIDGCKGGWIVARLQPEKALEIDYIESLQPFLKKAPQSATILIDMILYKTGETSPRPFDQFAKSELGKWHSRVFPAPPEEALTALDYPEACQRSFNLSGKKISKQCYHLFPKIREANHPSIPRKQLIEYHPEIAFKQLNDNRVIEPSKKTEAGQQIRQKIIENHLPKALRPLKLAPRTSPPKRKSWQADDILDALALALVARNKSYTAFYQALIKD